jgi:hypothetical protein
MTDEECYAAIADELNDPPDPAWAERNPPGYGPLTLDDFDSKIVAGAKRFAEANDLAWPPGCGDFDRYYDRKVNK